MPRNSLDTAFEAARGDRRAAVIPYLTAGYPDPGRYVDLACGVLAAGADALEIGVPFSDPLLDGPSIQRSQQAALDAGVTPADCIDYAAAIHARAPAPLLLMGAFNPVLAFGIDNFCAAAARAGVTALIIPDLPYEEQEGLRASAHRSNLHLIQLVAPTSTPERLDRVCRSATGFVYCISVSGVTGARSGVAETARPLVDRVRERTRVPVAVGFGIGSPDAVRSVASFADGAIVGSALIDVIGAAIDPVVAGAEFVRGLADAAGPVAAQ